MAIDIERESNTRVAKSFAYNLRIANRESLVHSEVSLPKMLYGTNVVEIEESDIARAFDLETRFVSGFIGQHFDAQTARLSRIDFCRNFSLSHFDPMRYVRALNRATLSRRKRVIYETGVSFKAKGLAIRQEEGAACPG